MSKLNHYLHIEPHPIVAIVKGVDRDVERGEDILMLGYSLVLMAPLFAPIAPPHILLPLMALCFIVSVCKARANFYTIQRRLFSSTALVTDRDLSVIKPIEAIFSQHPQYTLTDGFNPLKNLMRTIKSFLGGLLINPLWMPIFYVLGLQFAEEKQLQLLNKAVISVEQRIQYWR